MTAAKTRSQLGKMSRDKGAQAERDLVKYLRTVGFGGAERAIRTGYRTTNRTYADPGDVTGTPGIVWSVKAATVERLDTWLTELDAMHGPGTIRLLIHKRTGKTNPGRWWCWMRLTTLVWLGSGNTMLVRPGQEPVRMELGHAIPLLRANGYGDPTEVTA
jgi:hypothetical protein